MKKLRIIILIFTIFGLIFLVGGAFLCVNAFDYGNKAETTAVITDFESYRERDRGKWRTRYKTHLTYEVDGESYDNTVKMYSSSWNIGEKIEIYYDVDNPQNIGSKHTKKCFTYIGLLIMQRFKIKIHSIDTLLNGTHKTN